MSIENEIAGLTQSTTDLLEAVNTKKSTLDSAVDTAEAAKVVATSKAAEATTVVADASTHATNASNSATQAAASAASASQIVTGVATGLPNIRPSLNLDFVNSKRVDPRIDFTRSTTATYYDGETTVKAEENLLKDSQDWTASGWSELSVTRTANAGVAPDGTTTATAIIPSAANAYHAIRHISYPGFVAEQTFSFYAKANGYGFVGTRWAGLTGKGNYTFDLTTGTIVEGDGTDRSITDVGNGWYRCSVTFTPTSTLDDFRLYIGSTALEADADGFYVGDGTSSVLFWGAQLELRDTLTAYTPTTGYSITNYIPVLKTAGINEPRLDHDPVTGECKGLLIERDRTNYVNNSSDFTIGSVDWGYSNNVIVKNNVVIAPDGTLTGGKIIATGAGSRLGGHMSIGGAMVEGAVYTISGFYKHDGSYWTRVRLGGVFGNESATFDFTTGEFISTLSNVLRTSAVDVGNGWWRLAVTYVFQNSIGNLFPYAMAGGCDSPSGTTPTDSAEYNGVYIWGMQYERAIYPSSYIPTDGASAVRVRDRAVMREIEQWYNPQEGTIYTQVSDDAFPDVPGHNTQAGVFGVYNTSGRSYAAVSTGLNNVTGRDNFPVASVSNLPASGGGSIELGVKSRTSAFTYGMETLTHSAYGVDTGNVASNTINLSGTKGPLIADVAVLGTSIDYAYAHSRVLDGCIKCIKYYPQQVSDSEVSALAQG